MFAQNVDCGNTLKPPRRCSFNEYPQSREIFFQQQKSKVSSKKKSDNFNIFAQNIDYGYTLEPARLGGSNEYPQSMFWIKNKENKYTLASPSFFFFYIKVGFNGVYISRTCFPRITRSQVSVYRNITKTCHFFKL